MASLRVAHFSLGRVNPEAADGIDKTIYFLSRAQARLGHTVRLFSITNKPPMPIAGVTVSAYRSLEPWRLLRTRRLHDLFCWRSPLNLPRTLVGDLLAWRPDILHFHGVHVPQHVVLGSRLRRASIPYCISVHGMLASGARRRHRFSKRLAAIWEKPHIDNAMFLHALNEGEAEDLQHYGARSPIVVAPNGIDAPHLLESCEGHEATAADAEDGLRFVFLGRLDPEQKGLDLLIEGFSDAGLGKTASLILVGPSWRDSQPRLAALAATLGVGAQVLFTGPVSGPRKVALLLGASVFVHPSRWEGLSFSVLEAAACGRPCLLTPASDPGGRFDAASASLTVAPTRAGIADGLRRFAQMAPAQRAAMGRQGRDVVEEAFSWVPIARTITTAYGPARPAEGA